MATRIEHVERGEPLCMPYLRGGMGQAAENGIHFAVIDIRDLDKLGAVGGCHEMWENIWERLFL